MMTVQLNGEIVSVNERENLCEFLERKNYQNNTFAVAINESFIPRNRYRQVFLQEGDQIEILTAMQGG